MDKKTKATLAWEAILAILVMKKDIPDTNRLMRSHMQHVPKPHLTAVQFIMIGSGLATPELIPDGDWGEQSDKSLNDLYWATNGS